MRDDRLARLRGPGLPGGARQQRIGAGIDVDALTAQREDVRALRGSCRDLPFDLRTKLDHAVARV